jgi:hypothetical protein
MTLIEHEVLDRDGMGHRPPVRDHRDPAGSPEIGAVGNGAIRNRKPGQPCSRILRFKLVCRVVQKSTDSLERRDEVFGVAGVQQCRGRAPTALYAGYRLEDLPSLDLNALSK